MTEGEDESTVSSVSAYIPGVFFAWGIVLRGEAIELVEDMVIDPWEYVNIHPVADCRFDWSRGMAKASTRDSRSFGNDDPLPNLIVPISNLFEKLAKDRE